jgi:hypothetical protein
MTLLGRGCPSFFNRLSGILDSFPDSSCSSFCSLLDCFSGFARRFFYGFSGLLDWALVLRPNQAERQTHRCKDDQC